MGCYKPAAHLDMLRRRMVDATTPQPKTLASASGLLFGTEAVAIAVGALVGWLLGGAALGALVGAAVGIPLAAFVVYKTYTRRPDA